MKRCLFLMFLCLSACTSKTEVPPSLTPTPDFSSVSLSDLTGQQHSHDESACTEGSSCAVSTIDPSTLNQEALPLIQQEAGEFSIGMPEGYGAVIDGDEILISAISPETRGGFMVSIEPTENKILEDAAPLENPFLNIIWRMMTDNSARAIVIFPEGQQFEIKAFADPGYWIAFEATFKAMLSGLQPRLGRTP